MSSDQSAATVTREERKLMLADPPSTTDDWAHVQYDRVERLVAALDAMEDERDLLREALIAMREVAAVADNGDPWYCENEGVDASAAFALARKALGEAEADA